MVEREGRGALEQRISGGIALGVGARPQQWAAGERYLPSPVFMGIHGRLRHFVSAT
jgi:hypothetical protein